MKKSKINRSIEFRNGTYSSIVTIVVIALVIVVNLLVNALPASITTFETNGVDYYSISDSTKEYLKKLDTNVNIYLMSDSSGTYEEYADTICSVFKDSSSYINLEKIDVVGNPTFTAKYNAAQASSYSVVVENPSTGKYKLIDYTEIYYGNSQYDESGNSYTTYYYDGEGCIVSAIDYVINEVSAKVYEVTGHGEQSLTGTSLADAIDKCNFGIASEALNLTDNAEIPSDCDVLMLYAPSSDYTEAEANLIKDYIASGGSVISLYSRKAESMENFESILSYVGLEVTYGVVIENDDKHYYSSSQYPQYTLIPDLSQESTITSDMCNSYIITMLASTVKQVETSACTTDYIELLTTSNNYQFYDLEAKNTVAYTEPASLATYVAADFTETGKTGKVMVVSNAAFLEQVVEDTTILNNNIRFITNTIGQMTGKENSFAVDAKTLDERFNITTQNQVNMFTLVYLCLIPVTFIIMGFCVWYLRRSK